MAVPTATIQEFLVALGFQVDNAGLKKFGESLGGAGVKITALVGAVAAAEAALMAMLKTTASEMERLYYMAQRSGTTVDNLRMLQFGMRQIGLTADDAASALESMAMSLRFNPGQESLLKYLRVETRNANGSMRDTTAIFHDFIARLSDMPPYLAKQYASMFGISERTLFMLLNSFKTLEQADDRWKQIAKATGVNFQTAGENSKNFNNALRETGEIADAIWIRISSSLMKQLTPGIKAFNQFLLDNADETIQRLEHLMAMFEKTMGDAIREAQLTFKILAPEFMKNIDAMEARLKAFQTWLETTWFYKHWDEIHDPKKMLGTPEGMTRLTPHPEQTMPPGDIAKRGQSTETWGDIIHRFIWGQDHQTEEQKKQSEETWKRLRELPDAISRALKELQGLPITSSGFDPSMVHNANFVVPGGAPANSNSTPGFVGTQGQGEAGKFFGWVESKLGLPTGLLDRVWAKESGRGRNMLSKAGAMGHFQFMPGTAARFHLDDPNDLGKSAYAAGQYLQVLLQMFHGNLAKALAGYNWGEKNVMNAESRWGGDWFTHAPGETQDYVNKILGGGSYLGAGGGAGRNGGSINQNTNIHVHGSEPHATGQEVGRQQDRVNQRLVRNFRTAVIA